MDLETFRKLATDRRVIPVTRKLLADGDTPVALYRKLAAERPAPSSWSPRRTAAPGPAIRSLVCAAPPPSPPATDRPTGSAPRPSVSRPTVTPSPPCAPPSRPCTPPPGGPAALHRRHGRLSRLRHRPPPGEDRPRRARRPQAARADHAPHQRPRRDGPLGGLGPADRQRDQPQRPRHRCRRGVRGRDRPPRRHGGGPLPRGGPAARPAPALRASGVHRAVGRPRLQGGRRGHQGAHPRHEAFQVVPSQRFETPCTASALDVYRVLRATNPSPYMYLFRFDGFDVVGSSPEALVKVEDGRAMVHPIMRHPAPRGDPAGGPGPRRRAPRRPQGACRTPHAGRPRP